MTIKLWPMAVFLFLIILSSISFAQNISLNISGACNYYNVTITAALPEACYDVKIDAVTLAGRVGEIFDPRQGWKSSFFYINEAFCINKTEPAREFRLRAETELDKINFIAKLRLDDKVWETEYYEVEQNCPEPDDRLVFAVALIVVLILLLLVTWYAKSGQKNKKKSKK